MFPCQTEGVCIEGFLFSPFVDAATSIDPQNRGNTFISYYTYGAAIGLGLQEERDVTLPVLRGLAVLL